MPTTVRHRRHLFDWVCFFINIGPPSYAGEETRKQKQISWNIASHANVLRGSSREKWLRDEPVRTSAWEATWNSDWLIDWFRLTHFYLNKEISSVTKLLYMKAGLKCRNTPKAICSDCRWLRLNQQCFNYCLKLYLVFIVSSRCLVFKRPSAFGLGYVNVPLSR